MTETTYTTLRSDGEVISRELTLESAAYDLLTSDAHSYVIVAPKDEAPDSTVDEEWFRLFVSRRSRNAFGGDGGLDEWPYYYGSTEAEVLEKVIQKGGVSGTTAMTDADYDAMLAALDIDA